jgi:hypothetical protein
VSDLADLAEALTKDLPISARKVIDTALEHGWELSKPGMTVALRLNHPSDELAQPVYVTWVVGRTAKGAMSFRFNNCGTKGLVPLSPAELLEYLSDPTIIYMTDEDMAEADRKRAERERKPWDNDADPVTNVINALGAKVMSIDVERPPRQSMASRKTFQQLQAEQRAKALAQEQMHQRHGTAAPPLRIAAPALRIQAPKP